MAKSNAPTVTITWSTGYLTMDAEKFAKIPMYKLKRLFSETYKEVKSNGKGKRKQSKQAT